MRYFIGGALYEIPYNSAEMRCCMSHKFFFEHIEENISKTVFG